MQQTLTVETCDSVVRVVQINDSMIFDVLLSQGYIKVYTSLQLCYATARVGSIGRAMSQCAASLYRLTVIIIITIKHKRAVRLPVIFATIDIDITYINVPDQLR